MHDMLTQIKRAILHGQYDFSQKAQLEMERDGLTEYDVLESILTAPTIYKTLRSRSRFRQGRREQLYIIQSTNYDGLFIYTKGKWVQAAELRRYYFLVSAKRAI